MAREAGIIQLVPGKLGVLYAYTIQEECKLTAGTGCSAVDTVFPLPLKSLCIIRRPQCQVKKALSKSAAHQQAAPLCGCCRGLLGAWNRIVSRERSRGWAPQCTAVLVALLCTPTLFLSCSASDNRSISCSLSQPLSPMLVSFVLPSSLHCILRTFDTDHFPPHSFLYSCLLYFFFKL